MRSWWKRVYKKKWAHVRALQTEGGFEQRDEFLEVATVLVIVYEVFELVCVNHDVETAHLRQSELLVVDTSEAHLQHDIHLTILAGGC